MNVEMNQLHDALDKYFLNDEPDVLLFRAKFHGIQKRLLSICTSRTRSTRSCAPCTRWSAR